MKTSSQKPKNLLAAAVASLILSVLLFAIPAYAQTGTWSAWQPCGDNVSISFCQVDGSTWTWKFRNDGTQKITYMDFNYTDNTGKNYDLLPGSLAPGQVTGGWAAFTAASAPSIQIKSIQFADSAAPTNSTSQAQQNSGSTSSTTGQQGAPPAPPGNSQPTPPTPQLTAQQQRLLQSAQQNLANAQADQAAGAAFQAELSDYGKWMTLNGASYWQPNEATTDPNWRPYCTGGRWAATDLGWAWQSDYEWGWAGFHYGRWANDPVLGWIWQPGSVWAPAWVSWRNNDTYCGWAPLPPGAEYAMNFGFTYNGVTVSADFGFGLGADDYCFINVSDIDRPSYGEHLVAHDRVLAVYKETVIIKESYKVHDGRIINNGIALDRVRKITGRDIQPIKVSLGPERIAQKGPIDGRLPLRQISFAVGDKPRVELRGVAAQHSMIDDLLKADDAHAAPRPARASRSDAIMDDLLSEKRPKASSEITYNSAGLKDHNPHDSDDVVSRLLAHGHEEPVRPPVQARPMVSRQEGTTESASRPTYQQPAREQVYQAPQRNYQQDDNRQQYQEQRNNQQEHNEQVEQQRQQQAEQERQQQQEQQQQREQERQQQAEQERQQQQEQQQQREQERQQQAEQERQQREQERQQQQEQQREQERQQQEQLREQQREQERQQQEQQREQQRQQQEEQRRQEQQQKKTYPY